MTRFGFSAFLKMLSLNDRPQRTEMRNRLRPGSGSGYDFHRQFRQLAHRYLADGEALEQLFAETNGWGNAAEGRAAREALEFLEEWRGHTPGTLFNFEPRLWEHSNGTFAVRYTPDFGIEIDGLRVAVHIWKTQHPPLDARMTYVALSLFGDVYSDDPTGPQDVAVLSVIDGRFYRLSDVADQAVLAERVVTAIDNLIDELSDEAPPPPPPGDQPGQRP